MVYRGKIVCREAYDVHRQIKVMYRGKTELMYRGKEELMYRGKTELMDRGRVNYLFVIHMHKIVHLMVPACTDVFKRELMCFPLQQRLNVGFF